jgi:hypothetical protein
MGAKKSPVFMFLPPSFCRSLCIGPAVPGDFLYPWNPAIRGRIPLVAAGRVKFMFIPLTIIPLTTLRPCSPSYRLFFCRANPHNGSNLQIMRFFMGCFCPKIRAVLQKNGGFREIILHFFLCFSRFLGFCSLHPVAFQQQAPLQPLQKKSCLKHYRRFFVRSGLCHDRRMNERKVQWAMGRRKPGARSSSVFVLSDFWRFVAAALSSSFLQRHADEFRLFNKTFATKERKEHIDRSLYRLFLCDLCVPLRPFRLWLRSVALWPPLLPRACRNSARPIAVSTSQYK